MRFLRNLPKTVNLKNFGLRFYLFKNLKNKKYFCFHSDFQDYLDKKLLFFPQFSRKYFGIGGSKAYFLTIKAGISLFCSFVNVLAFFIYNKDFFFSRLLFDLVLSNGFSTTSNLKTVILERFIFLRKVSNYRITRNNLGLSARGQRTHTNCLTQRKKLMFSVFKI
jgi:hypothetical protein